MFFQFKNKGGLVLVYAVIPLIVLFVIKALLNSYFFNDNMLKPFNGITFGIAVLISGFWTYYTSDDYYINEEGEKKYIYFDHQFMFIDMKSWAYVFWTIGGFALIGSVFELVEKLMR